MTGFNQKAFMKTEYQQRIAHVPVPALAYFFAEGEEPVWTVRGQTANEVSRAMEASVRTQNISKVIEAIGNSRAQVEDLKEAIGISEDTPQDIIKRLEQLVTCTISDEKIELPMAIKLAEKHPVEFYLITNKIVELTGLGMDIKKPNASGKAQK